MDHLFVIGGLASLSHAGGELDGHSCAAPAGHWHGGPGRADTGPTCHGSLALILAPAATEGLYYYAGAAPSPSLPVSRLG